MMELNSAFGILLLEAVLIGFIILGSQLYVQNRKKGHEIQEIDKFVEQLADEEKIKKQLLEKNLLKHSHVSPSEVELVLREVGMAERTLIKRVIEMFLQREPALLTEINQLISNLSNPYCRLLSKSDAQANLKNSENENLDTKLIMEAETKIAGLELVNKQLSKQLNTAMETIDDITAEYTRVFSGQQTALELENSSKKMLQIFLEVEKSIRENSIVGSDEQVKN